MRPRSSSFTRTCPSTLLATALLAGLAATQSGPVLSQSDGASSSQAFGGTMAGCGDLDGDGFPELLVGCQEYGSGNGMVRAISGNTGVVIHTWTAAVHGDGVADAGDVDADGVTDVLVGDTFSSPDFPAEGSAWVYSGSTGAELYRFNGGGAHRYLGADVSGLGDVDADGYADFILGAWGEQGTAAFSGVVYVRSGFDGSVIHELLGTIDHGYFGTSVTGVADVDGDAIPDFAVGAVGEDSLGSNTGAVSLYSGASGTLIRSWTGPEGNSRFGGEVRGVGDADGDGSGDLIVGAMFTGPNGAAFLLSGATGTVLQTYTGYHPDEVFGKSVDGAGDIDGDGLDDVIIGSDHYYVAGGYTGFAYVFSGASGEKLQDFRAGSPTARLGNAVAGVGDVNGDGIPDLAVGAIDENTPSGNKSGRAFLFSGATDGLLYDIEDFDAGATASFRAAGAELGSAIVFVFSLTGDAPLPTSFGLASLTPPVTLLPFVLADPLGNAELLIPLPPAATGLVLYTQAFELFGTTGGRISHPLTVEMH